MFSLFQGFLWAFLRRWYGGMFEEEQHPVLANRGLQSVVMILCTMPLLFIPQFSFWTAISISLLLSLWVQFQHWSRAVGCILDSGRNHSQNESNYDRWYRVVLDKIYDGVNFCLEKMGCDYRIEKYKGFYDFWYTGMRFGFPLMLLAPISWGYTFIGFCAAPIYFLSWRIFEEWPELYYKMPHWAAQPKDLAEILYGFVFGFGFATIFVNVIIGG